MINCLPSPSRELDEQLNLNHVMGGRCRQAVTSLKRFWIPDGEVWGGPLGFRCLFYWAEAVMASIMRSDWVLGATSWTR